MAQQLKLSCDNDKKDSGPTLIHSTGVENYKIPPEVIRFLQETLTNDNLSDHDDGVLCQATPQHVLDILSQNGFTVQDENDEDDKTTWTVTQGEASGGADGEEERVQPSDGNEAEAEAEGDGDGGAAAAGDEEQGGDEEGGQQQEDEEQEKEE